MLESSWHTLAPERVARVLGADPVRGLSSSEASARLSRYGRNVFSGEVRETLLGRLVRQFRSPLVSILLLAGVATLALREYVDATVILIALAVNITIGLFQEARASRAFEKLAASQERTALVVRDGTPRVVPAEVVVPGDRIVLKAGSLVPADTYLTEARELEASEAPLTGESVPVEKEVGVCRSGTPLTERHNLAFMGTLIVSGEGRGLVVATGNGTEVGKIAESLAETRERETPIQKNIRRLARFLSVLILAIVGAIFIFGLVRGESLETMLLLAIAVAVSVIPEGLPAAVTAVLAIGMEKILSHGGLVRNLLAAETLGSTTVILTDKTGTITQAQMHLALVATAEGVDEVELSGTGRAVLVAALRASDAFIERAEDGAETVRGRPLERAIVERALEEKLDVRALIDEAPRQDFLPFDSHRRFAAALAGTGERRTLYVSGAPEVLLGVAEQMRAGGGTVPMSDAARARFAETFETYARRSVRFTAVGYKETFLTGIPEMRGEKAASYLLDGLVFLGLLGFEDPVRPDVPESIVTARAAGARIIMVTGDTRETAESIALAAGIIGPGALVHTGTEVEAMSDDELRETLKRSSVFARMLPEQKLRMVKLLQGAGEVVAMTGDGVNDAPALKQADIGVAVGAGTEVAQEASDLILLNNSFSIIVAAIEEGRRIIDNLKKSVVHMLSTSFHEVFIIAASIFSGLPVPILATQIIWVNILEEGFLTFGFAFEPAEEGLMKRDPREERTKTVLTREVRKIILTAGIITGVFSFVLYLGLLAIELPIEEIRTLMFVVLSLDALFFALSLKHLRKPFWHARLFGNRYLLFALLASITGIVLSLTVPALRSLLSLVPLRWTEVLLLTLVGLFNLLTIEMTKRFVFRKER